MKRIFANLVAAAAIVLAVLLFLRMDSLWPFSLPEALKPFGWIFLGAGLLLIGLSEASFLARGGGTGAPADPPRKLVISGIYRWTRNPIYLGAAQLLLGLALIRPSPTLLLIASLFLPVLHFFVVYREEPHLESTFGIEYREYKLRVPRWIPRPPNKG